MQIIEWEVPSKDKNSKALINRNTFATSKSNLSTKEMTLVYTHFLPWQLSKMLSTTLAGYQQKIKGTGVELGAGTALLSTQLVNLYPAVEKVYALEYVDEVVKRIQPKVITEFCQYQNKVLPTIGSFDEIALPDESVDFIFQIESLHHSNHLPTTYAEQARILKKGGILISYDRVHPDTVTDADVDKLLDVAYTTEFKRKYGYPEDGVLTRRMNGEHEYRLHEWKDAMDKSGLKLVEMIPLKRSPDKIANSLKRLLKMPHEKVPKVSKDPMTELKQGIKGLLSNTPYSPKGLTFFVAEKI